MDHHPNITTEFPFDDVTDEQQHGRVALVGPAGSGKTWTALCLADGLAGADGVTGVVDTEHGSARLYRRHFRFRHQEVRDNYHPNVLVRALAAAAHHGIDVVVVDSLSLFWAGPGGMLESVDKAARRSYGGNQFGGWKEMRPDERAMMEALLAYPGHVIVTARTKTAYEVGEDERGRKTPRKIGLKPEQREGLEYEFDIVGDLDLDNTLAVTKSRCFELAGDVIRKPDQQLGVRIGDWLADGTPAPTANNYRARALDPDVTFNELGELRTEAHRRGLAAASVLDEHGEATTLNELITRRGRGLASSGSNTERLASSGSFNETTVVREAADVDITNGLPDEVTTLLEDTEVTDEQVPRPDVIRRAWVEHKHLLDMEVHDRDGDVHTVRQVLTARLSRAIDEWNASQAAAPEVLQCGCPSEGVYETGQHRGDCRVRGDANVS